MRLSFKAEIQPTPTQRKALLQHAGCARWAYNWGLRQRKDAYARWVAEGKPRKWDGWKNAASLHRDLNQLKRLPVEDGGVPWMYASSKCAPQEALRNLDLAFRHFFRRLKDNERPAGFPRFKSKRRGPGGFRLTGAIRVFRERIQLPVIGRVKFKPGERGYVPTGRYPQVSVTEKAGRWFVSVLAQRERSREPAAGPAVGLDLGCRVLATLSDGTEYANTSARRRHRKKLGRAQKSLSRKKKESNNRRRAALRVARIQARIANVRRNALHQTTTAITKRFGLVVMEDLRVAKMTRRGGRRKAGLNRAMSDAALGEFRRQMEYKASLYGCSLVLVNPAHTSQDCHLCGHRTNPGSRKVYRCARCGWVGDRDLNAAKNIYNRYVAGSCSETLNACGETISLPSPREHDSVKQEPSGVL